jgi:hypothetical protein
LTGEVDDVWFQRGNAAFEVVDVFGCAEAGFSPGLFAEEFGECFLQLPDTGV